MESPESAQISSVIGTNFFKAVANAVLRCERPACGIIVTPMAGPSEPGVGAGSGTGVRPPAVAGSFYPADPNECRVLARQLVAASGDAATPRESNRRWL